MQTSNVTEPASPTQRAPFPPTLHSPSLEGAVEELARALVALSAGALAGRHHLN